MITFGELRRFVTEECGGVEDNAPVEVRIDLEDVKLCLDGPGFDPTCPAKAEIHGMVR